MQSLNLDFISELKSKKNLLAFSSGGDSTALFFALLFLKIPFDIAIVNYHKRKQASLEISRARNLAFFYQKKCFIRDSTTITQNFEAKARNIRYDFFKEIITKYDYKNLLLAHHLNDSFEWFLMQFCKGTSMEFMSIPPKANARFKDKNYHILRPLWKISKKEILDFLHKNNLFYFEDFSNDDESYKRNFFRKNFSNALIKKYQSGITFSLELLNKNNIEIKDLGGFYIFNNDNALIKISKACKNLGLLLSKNQKLYCEKLLERKEFSSAFSGKISIEKMENKIFIAPLKTKILDKKEKEFYRIHKIPQKIRKFFSTKNIDKNELLVLLNKNF